MKIIPATEPYRSNWIEMRLALWPECPRDETDEEITRILTSGREAAFLALSESGDVAGFAEVSTREYVDGCHTSPVGYLEGIYVRPEYRQQKVGEQLVRAGEEWSRSKGCTEMGSDTRLEDDRSIAFHQAVGFRETERQVVFLKSI